MSYAELLELRSAAKAAYLKSLQAVRLEIGQGSTARTTERNRSEQLKAELLDWDRQIATHPDNPERRSLARRAPRVMYIR